MTRGGDLGQFVGNTGSLRVANAIARLSGKIRPGIFLDLYARFETRIRVHDPRRVTAFKAKHMQGIPLLLRSVKPALAAAFRGFFIERMTSILDLNPAYCFTPLSG